MAVAVDASSPALVSGTNSTVTTASFSPPADTELWAFVGRNGPVTGTDDTGTVSGGGLTWTLAGRKSSVGATGQITGGTAQPGCVEVWYAYTASALTGITITDTRTDGVSATGRDHSLQIQCVTGTEGGTWGGAIAANGSSSGTPSTSLTTTRNGSLVFGAISDWAQAGNATAGSGVTKISEYNNAGQISIHFLRRTATTTTSGTSVTVNVTAPSGEQYNMLVVEVRAPSAGGTDGSVTGVTATATASATAPTVAGGAAVTGVAGSATASALAPTVSASADGSVTAVTATATARGWEPVVGASFNVTAVAATATASATAPVVLAGAGVTPGAAAALAFGQAPSVSGGFAVNVAPPAATATASGQVPLVQAGASVAAVASTATATARVPGLSSGAFSVPAATATAFAWRPVTFPAPEGGVDSGMASEELQACMQRVSGTDLDAQGAANVWAGTLGLELLAALNAKAGNTVPRGLLEVLNQLAGTANLDVAGAAARITA